MGEWRRRVAVVAGAVFRRLPTDLRQRLAPGLRRIYHRQVAGGIPQAAGVEAIDRGRRWGVGVFGYLTAESGVGEGARGSVEALQAAGVPVSAHNVEMGVYANREAAGPLATGRDNPFAVNLVHLNADLMATLPELIGAANHAGRYTIGYWAWELAEFPEALVPAFEAVHEVWVPSRFVAGALAEKTDKPVRVMPHRVEVAAPAAVSRSRFGLMDKAVVFLAAVDLNSFIERKNIFGTVEAFRRAFAGGAADVQLVIKAHGRVDAFRAQRARLAEAVRSDPRIVLIDRVLPRAEVTELQAAADVFVSLHRAEGFGLPIAECMALGKLAIATDYSGSTDFVSADCAMPVPYRLVEVGDTAYPLGEGQVWAEPDLDAAAELMRVAAADPELRAGLGKAAAARIAADYGTAVIGARMAARLDEIRDQLGGW